MDSIARAVRFLEAWGAPRPITYTPMLWSLVFPFGMYALASLRLSVAADFTPLRLLSGAMVWVALCAWSLTAAGLIVSMWRGARGIGGT